MHFRTELHPAPAAFKLSLTSKVVTVGSCFSDVIGSHLERYKVETLTNPFGTLFNPLSACKLLQICAGADVELADSFVQNNGRWYSYDFHSSFSAETEEELYEMLDEVIVKTRRFLKKADLLLLTLGTANIFRLNITGETVANCHKIPAANFTRETLLPEEIITAVAETHSLLRELNPNLKLGLTVSPVRHIKDSLELNSVSKAVLRLATHFLTESLPDISYFPAYELLIDDLRDYRFYKEDMLHPTPMAEAYIWEKFTGAYFESEFQLFTQEWDKILRAREHKPFLPESAQHQAFIQNTLEKLRILQHKVNVEEELAYFESQVILIPEPVEEPDSEEEEDQTEVKAIPGYFSEESAKVEELETAALTETTAVTLPEEATVRKKKKKPRKKKRKPAAATEETSLNEVGTAQVSEVTIPVELPSEPNEELAEILADPAHEIAHYGETLSEAPVKRPLSKSAKRRESRKKKRALEAQQTLVTPIISEETSIAQPEEIIQPETTFAAENASVLEEKITEPTPEISAEKPKRSAGKKASQNKSDRKKKNTFPDLFAAEKPAVNEPELPVQETKLPEPTVTLETAKMPQASENAEVPSVKVSTRGRKPKADTETAKKPKAKPVKEIIAVPFVPAVELDKPVTGTEAPKKRTRPVKAKAEKPAKPENTILENPPVPETKKPEKPVRKPKVTGETVAKKPGSKKKIAPEL